MTCPKCNAECMEGSTFCVKCGANLKELAEKNVTEEVKEAVVEKSIETPAVEATPVETSVVEPTPVVEKPVENPQPVVTPQPAVPVTSNVSNEASLNYFMYIIAILLKPFKCFKEEEGKLSQVKTSLIFSLIVSVGMMLITLITTMLSVIFTKTMDFETFKMKTTLNFSTLKDLNYLSLIGKNLLIYAGIIAAIALIYYVVSLIFKKTTNYIKILSITATSVIPYIVLGMIAAPLLGKIWFPLSIVCSVVGAVYSILIFITLIDDYIGFDNKDTRIYFHLICLAIIGVAGYYLYMNLFLGGLSSDLNDLLDMFE